MGVGIEKNFKNPTMDFSNISPFVNKHINKQADPDRQILKTVNFAFIKIFDFFVKIAI